MPAEFDKCEFWGKGKFCGEVEGDECGRCHEWDKDVSEIIRAQMEDDRRSSDVATSV